MAAGAMEPSQQRCSGSQARLGRVAAAMGAVEAMEAMTPLPLPLPGPLPPKRRDPLARLAAVEEALQCLDDEPPAIGEPKVGPKGFPHRGKALIRHMNACRSEKAAIAREKAGIAPHVEDCKSQ